MAYTITVRIYQFDTSTFFPVVEKTVWNYANGGTWRESDGQHILTMGGSGTSGTLRFKSDTGEEVIFTVGVHNFKPWCDAVPDAKGDTGMTVHAQYYNDGCRSFQREYQATEWNSRGPGGRLFTVKYIVKGGHHLLTSVIIG